MKPKTFYIPHLHYTIEVRLASGASKKRITEEGWFAYTESDENMSTVYLGKKPSLQTVGTISHELIHALQHLCRARSIHMERESEHMAYLMQWIMAGILGFKLART